MSSRPSATRIDFGRRGSLSKLEEVVMTEVEAIVNRAWRPTANNEALADRLGLLCKLLVAAGYDDSDVRRRWKVAYDVYKLDGGRARWRDLYLP